MLLFVGDENVRNGEISRRYTTVLRVYGNLLLGGVTWMRTLSTLTVTVAHSDEQSSHRCA